MLPLGPETLFQKNGPMRLSYFTFLGCLFIFFRFWVPDIHFCWIVWTQSENAWVEQSVTLLVKVEKQNTVSQINVIALDHFH